MDIINSFLKFSLLGAEWVMWVLVALSVFSITIMIERLIYFWGRRPQVDSLIEELPALLAKMDLETAKKRVTGIKGVAPAVALAALNQADRGSAAADEAGSGALVRERQKLERNLAFLGTVGNNAPFIGLFGTVIGIITAFHHLSLNTQGGASTVMAGISEALVATAIGLLVAIPAVAAFNAFQRRIKVIIGDANVVMHAILSGLKGETEKKRG